MSSLQEAAQELSDMIREDKASAARLLLAFESEIAAEAPHLLASDSLRRLRNALADDEVEVHAQRIDRYDETEPSVDPDRS